MLPVSIAQLALSAIPENLRGQATEARDFL
jgi:hypothetical protein